MVASSSPVVLSKCSDSISRVLITYVVIQLGETERQDRDKKLLVDSQNEMSATVALMLLDEVEAR